MNPYDSEILVITGNRTTMSFTLNFLCKQGYRVDGAIGYLDALKKIEGTGYDLVIFFGELEDKEKDYVENIATELSVGHQFLHFSGPVQQLPERINRLMEEKK
jgi:hypothetical protein